MSSPSRLGYAGGLIVDLGVLRNKYLIGCQISGSNYSFAFS